MLGSHASGPPPASSGGTMRNLLIAGGAIFVAFFMVLNLGPGSGACPTGELGELTARNVERVASAAAAREVAKALAAVQAGVRAAGTAVQVAAPVAAAPAAPATAVAVPAGEASLSLDMFENLSATYPSPAAIRAASLDRWTNLVGKGFNSDTNMDMFDETTGKVAASPRLKVVSLNPKPIVMLESKFTISQFAYVRTYHGEANVRKVMRLVYEAEGTGCDAPLADDDFSYATLPDKWDLKRAKSGGRNEGALVLDIGANEGFYSMMASAYGCRVVSFEPQPMCVALISAAIAFNNFRHPVKLINRVVQNQKVEFWAPNEQCSGVVQYTKTKDDEKNSNDQLVKSATIDDIVEANGGSRVILAHMDVEGAEIRVLESGLKSIQAKKIDNFVVEVNFGRWQNYGVTVEHARSVLEQVRTGGDFVCRSLDVGGGGDPRTYPIIESWNTYDFPKEIDAWCTSDPKFKQVITESQANQKSYHTGNAPSTFNYNEQ